MTELPENEEASSLSVREARARFFAESGFGADGGYDDAWAEAEFGPILYRVPNIRARARALRIHDLHHLVTGYSADWRGEAEISAWELGSGWGRHPYAWIIALFGFVTGLFAQPRATFVAFVRGRRSENLYWRKKVDALLDRRLSALKLALQVPDETDAGLASKADLALFLSTSVVALVFGVFASPFVGALVLIGETRRGWLAQRGPCSGLPAAG